MSAHTPSSDPTTPSAAPKRAGSSVRQRNLGITPKRHEAIRRAAEVVSRDPSNAQSMAALSREIVAAVERSIAPRARGRQVRLQQRAVALISTYADFLTSDLRNDLRERVRGPVAALEGLVAQQETSPYISEREAALRLGVTIDHLLRMCELQANRRALGWPRPLGDAVMFLRDALVAETARECLAAQPTDEPWPSSSWPERWR